MLLLSVQFCLCSITQSMLLVFCPSMTRLCAK
nr:MAG TPA: hypothetical protein [Caudoviricetes sp.]